MIEHEFLADAILQFQKLKEQAERAIAQVDDGALFALIDPDANSIAIIMKHMAGNMRSRWTDFLTTDGEKPDRNRDTEFEQDEGETRGAVMARWNDGWERTLAAIGTLQPDDLSRTVSIRGEPHLVMQAINRQLTHYAAHVGQIVLLAKHFAGSNWKSLSIPKGKSKEFDVSRAGAPYRV